MKKRILTVVSIALILALTAFALTACKTGGGTSPQTSAEATNAPDDSKAGDGKHPSIPEKLTLKDDMPVLKVYNVDSKKIEEMDIETYIEGVVAGEMRNDWPMEALKAQAILARTFVLKFVSEKSSKYSGADISTDINEAQAYDKSSINDRIKKAVKETRGEVMSHNGTFPYAWFHAHAGGQTELANISLDYKEKEPPYTQSVKSPDSDKAPDDVKEWTVTFSAKEVGDAAADTGVKTGAVTSIEIGEKGESGRAKDLIINGKTVSASSLRIALDSKKLKSTLLTEVKLENGKVTFSGKGYGHGVGMSQWGAYGMADEGKKAEEIVEHYFKDVNIVSLWK